MTCQFQRGSFHFQVSSGFYISDHQQLQLQMRSKGCKTLTFLKKGLRFRLLVRQKHPILQLREERRQMGLKKWFWWWPEDYWAQRRGSECRHRRELPVIGLFGINTIVGYNQINEDCLLLFWINITKRMKY